MPVPRSELDELLARLDEAVEGTAAGFKRGGYLVCGLILALAVSFAVQRAWGVTAIVAAFGVGIFLIMRAAARRNAPEKMRPVVAAVRDTPERVVSLRH